ncbi:MAG: hypothetical protein V2J25_06890 [Desulfatiglans sp.]|jgi:hypothetical protein|nr:hypothetical protein [Thermodesulfobacteriota bacterium]MEE4352583.1 hypothetical protein [Desulfatiglans sp.]
MEEKNKRDNKTCVPLPCSSDLRGRQSVRATFRLTGKAINAISIVSTHLGVKQKSLFDHLIEDMHSLRAIAEDLHIESFTKMDRVQKTYVMSRKTLSNLEEASKEFDAPRDALVEFSIQRLLPVIEEERKKHRKRKEILDELMGYLKRGEVLLENSKKSLGKDDPVYEKLESVIKAMSNAHTSIESFVKKGEVIEDF